jgi:hypothetical protein
MHGIVFAELQRFVQANHGPEAWTQLLKAGGLAGKLYLPVNEYPDTEIKALVAAAAKMTGRPAPAILEDFGDFITPSLIAMYGHLLSPKWTALDIIENTEGTVHTVVRVKNPGARPPQLSATRVAPNEVLLRYNSPRQMCFLAIGIGRGLGRHFRQNLSIQQGKCMYKGDAQCEIRYRLLD